MMTATYMSSVPQREYALVLASAPEQQPLYFALGAVDDMAPAGSVASRTAVTESHNIDRDATTDRGYRPWERNYSAILG